MTLCCRGSASAQLTAGPPPRRCGLDSSSASSSVRQGGQWGGWRGHMHITGWQLGKRAARAQSACARCVFGGMCCGRCLCAPAVPLLCTTLIVSACCVQRRLRAGGARGRVACYCRGLFVAPLGSSCGTRGWPHLCGGMLRAVHALFLTRRDACGGRPCACMAARRRPRCQG